MKQRASDLYRLYPHHDKLMPDICTAEQMKRSCLCKACKHQRGIVWREVNQLKWILEGDTWFRRWMRDDRDSWREHSDRGWAAAKKARDFNHALLFILCVSFVLNFALLKALL